MFLPPGVFSRASNRRLRALADVRGILTVDDATRCNRARHQFRAVAAARAHIEHLHAGMRAGEGQELDRVAPLVGLHVRFGAVGRGNDGGVIGRAILRRRCSHRQASAQKSGNGQTACHQATRPSQLSLSGHVVVPSVATRLGGSLTIEKPARFPSVGAPMYVLSVWAARRGCAALLTRCRPPAALCAARTKDFITPV